eukprot:TRINITY_DN3527_c0_g1_i1.p2 TRINITY_DN3527_c0_g1~~TRINITY_DN3527_c0_g1_i1.p2  ORF type:complete len:169 (-),score=27.18 TRINITY_DN3527_c0_g1_i1:2-508(-)
MAGPERSCPFVATLVDEILRFLRERLLAMSKEGRAVATAIAECEGMGRGAGAMLQRCAVQEPDACRVVWRIAATHREGQREWMQASMAVAVVLVNMLAEMPSLSLQGLERHEELSRSLCAHGPWKKIHENTLGMTWCMDDVGVPADVCEGGVPERRKRCQLQSENNTL